MVSNKAITTQIETVAKNDNEVFSGQSIQQLIAAQDMFSPEHAAKILKDYFQIKP